MQPLAFENRNERGSGWPWQTPSPDCIILHCILVPFLLLALIIIYS